MKEDTYRYYKIICKCGHLGRKKYIPIAFPVKAFSGKQAAAIARNIPRVKHQHKDAILSVKEISFQEYNDLIIINNNDPYLKCSSRKEQRKTCDLSSRWVADPHYVDFKKEKAKKREHRKERIRFLLKRERIILTQSGGNVDEDLY